MKTLKYLYTLLLILLISCSDSVLDKKPLDIISDAVVWEDQALIDAYLTNVYINMDILENETPNSDWESSIEWNGPFIINEMSDEGMSNWIRGQSQTKWWGLRIGGGLLEWWERSYAAIRDLNVFIKRVAESSLDNDFKTVRVAEARFLRAYNYFSMVKRYGGVPLITEAQAIDAPYEELYRTRDSEKVIYDFVISEMDAIESDLPEKSSTEMGRPSKYAALALKSRAALYAASIANYGSIQLNGLLGIPKSEAAKYYQTSFDASSKIIHANQYHLYNADDNKVLNFKNVFIKKQSEGNPESIWVKAHDYTMRGRGGNGWVWDFFQCPKPQAWGAGNQNAPYLEMAEEFEYADGTSGKLNRQTIGARLWSMEELWANKDPRFFATIYTNGTSWKGGQVDSHNGLLLPDGTVQNDGAYKDIPARGNQTTDNNFGTSFGVMKYLEETKDNMGERATSGTDFILFRYGEVLLNHAEAAIELGKTAEALSAVNQIRKRAGIAELATVDINNIIHERKVELAFEGHRYWDLRRWRMAVDKLNSFNSGIRYILDVNTRKYKIEILEKIEGGNNKPVFHDYNYYFPITLSRTSNNPNLVENPGYN